MPRAMNDIAVDFDALTEWDFDRKNPDARGWEQLDSLCDEMSTHNDAVQCVPVMLRTMERLEEVDLGSPGPLVHTMEAWPGEYERFLSESMRRKPTPLTIWMVNRILNSKPPDAAEWRALLQDVANHPSASESAKLDAQGFLARSRR
jgi:hypothetical protein